MNKEQLILELNNLVNSIPKDVADRDYNQRYNQASDLQNTITSTEEELINMQNKLDGLDESASFEIISKEAEIREAQHELDMDELALSRFKTSVTNSEGELGDYESTLETLERINSDSDPIITNLENLQNSPEEEISRNARERLERIEQERIKREKQIANLRNIIARKKEELEDRKRKAEQYEENLQKRRDHIQTLKDQLEEFRSANADKNTTDDTLRKIELQNRLVALRQAHAVLTINPVLEMQYIISEYEKDLIDQAEVAKRLEPLKAALSVTNIDTESREKELEDIAKLKEDLEAKIKESEAALADVNNTFSRSNRDLLPHQTYEAEEARRVKFDSQIRNLDLQNYQAEQQRKANVAQIMENEDLIDVARSEIRDIENDIAIISNMSISEEEKARQIAPYARELQVLNNDIVAFEQDNASLKLNNEQIALDKDSRNTQIERYQKQVDLINLKSKIDRGDRNVELIDLQSYKSELSALNLREQYLKLSIADRFDALLNKLPKDRLQENPKLNKSQQEIYNKILAGLPLEDRQKAIEKSKEFEDEEEQKEEDLNPEENNEDDNKKKPKNTPVPISGFRQAGKKIIDKLKNLWKSNRFKQTVAIFLASVALFALVKLTTNNNIKIEDLPKPPAIEQQIPEEIEEETPPIQEEVEEEEEEKTPEPEKPDEPDKPAPKPADPTPTDPTPTDPTPTDPTPTDPTPTDPTPTDPITPPAPGEYVVTLDPTVENPGENNFPESEPVFINVDGVAGNIDAYGTARMYPANGALITINDAATTELNPDGSGTFKISNIDEDKIRAKLNEDIVEVVTNPLPSTGEEITEEEAHDQVEEGTRDPGDQENADQAADDIFKELEDLLNGTDGTQLIQGENSEEPTEGQSMSR